MQFPSDVPIPESVLGIARKLDGAGHEVWCVGGVVRDALLGLPASETVDLATSATPDVVRQLFRRTVPIGIEHGTVAVLDRNGVAHEVTTFRRDVRTDGRHAVVEFGVSLDDDLARRDFTINAIAWHPLRHEWRDPFDGAADLERGVIRAVGDAAQRFREDYLRILRAVRFAARFGFTIEEATWEAARAAADGLPHLSAERVRDEWFKGLAGSREPGELVRLWKDVGALGRWLPEVRGAWAVVRGAWYVVRGLPRDPILITSALSSDPGTTLERLRCSNAEIERGRRIGAHRGREPDPADDVAVRRWLATVGEAADDLVAIARAEGREGALAEAVERVRQSGAPLTIGDLAISGKDLIEAGIPQGPRVGATLKGLLEAVLEHPNANTRDALLQRARQLASSPSTPTHHAPRTTHSKGRAGEIGGEGP